MAKSKIPVRIQSPSRPVASVRKNNAKRDTLSATVDTIVKELTSPTLLVALLAIAFLASNYSGNASDNVLVNFIKALSKNEVTKGIGTFLNAHIIQVFGAVCYTIIAVVCAPSTKTGLWVLTGVVIAFIVPESSVWQYVAQCILFSVYIKARRQDVRFMLIAIGVGLYFFGYLVPPKQ
ncbi:putative envelope protein [Linepithema humile C virus 1]|uniref:Envelope protein n=1 Tax=Linepithema humile C virus 1 TaxID=2259784 RepID=A0AC61U963_9VIRU|nr:putative envelope protein [Linepithema humile C-virus 1]